MDSETRYILARMMAMIEKLAVGEHTYQIELNRIKERIERASEKRPDRN